MTDLKSYWIEAIQEIKEFQLLANIEGDEISTLNSHVGELISDQFIEAATEQGLARREKMLKVTPFADDTLESRRFRVLSKWGDSLPYTYTSMLERLNQLCGVDGYVVSFNHENYTLDVKIALTVKRMAEDVDKMLHQMLPANLLITVELRYRQHKELVNYTHNQLKAYKHTALREEALKNE